MPQVILESSDNLSFPVEVNVARMFNTIVPVLNELGAGAEEGRIPLPNVRGEILQLVINWAQHHLDDPPEGRGDAVSQWDQDFLRVDQPILFDLVRAACYLDIQPLLDLTCKSVASLIKGKNPEEIRQTFNIRNDF